MFRWMLSPGRRKLTSPTWGLVGFNTSAPGGSPRLNGQVSSSISHREPWTPGPFSAYRWETSSARSMVDAVDTPFRPAGIAQIGYERVDVVIEGEDVP